MCSPISNNSGRMLLNSLDRAWWVSGKYGILSRIHSNLRSPIKMIQREGSLKLMLDNVFRICTVNNYLHITLHQSSEISDPELYEIFTDELKIDRVVLANKLNTTIRKLDYMVRRELKKYNLIQYQGSIWLPEYLSESIDYHKIEYEDLVIKVLDRYPYISIDQISYLTGIHPLVLLKPISELTSSEKIIRGLTRDDSPDELFKLNIKTEIVVDWDDCSVFVIEKRDALVEIIKLERYFVHKDGDFWIFINGIPQAEFDLDKIKGKKEYKITSFKLLPTAELSNSEIIGKLFEWAIGVRLKIDANIDDVQSKIAVKFTNMLISRGYQMIKDALTLRKKTDGKKIYADKKTVNVGYTWADIGRWYRDKQYLGDHDKNIEEIIINLVQVDSSYSIAYRMRMPPSNLMLGEIIYCYGIAFRHGFTASEHLQEILLAYPKMTNISIMDRQIITALSGSIADITKNTGLLQTEVKQRLLFLERNRIVRRDCNFPIDTDNCIWMPFTDDGNLKKAVIKPSNSAINDLIIKLLKNHIPLTLAQVSQFMGIKTAYLIEIKEELLRRGEILEGYYLDFLSEPQITLAEVIASIEEYEYKDDEEIPDQIVDILPFSDPIAIVQVRSLLLNHSELQPIKRYDTKTEWWLILWNGEPIGYLLKIPSDTELIDFDIHIKIRKGMDTIPVISALIQQIVNIFVSWFDDIIKIIDINNEPLDRERFEPLEFLLATLGLDN